MNISLDHPCPTSNGPSEPQILDNNHRDVKHWKMLWQSQWIRQKLSTNGFMIGLLLGLMFGCVFSLGLFKVVMNIVKPVDDQR